MRHIRLKVLPGVYEPAEDTFLLADTVADVIKEGRVLDTFAGTGYVGLSLMERGLAVAFNDYSARAVKNIHLNLRLNGWSAKVYRSWVFPPVYYDWIVANPPYLRGDWRRDPTIFAGKRAEVIKYLLRRAPKHTRHLVWVMSSETPIKIYDRPISELCLGDEKLMVYRRDFK